MAKLPTVSQRLANRDLTVSAHSSSVFLLLFYFVHLFFNMGFSQRVAKLLYINMGGFELYFQNIPQVNRYISKKAYYYPNQRWQRLLDTFYQHRLFLIPACPLSVRWNYLSIPNWTSTVQQSNFTPHIIMGVITHGMLKLKLKAMFVKGS